MVKTRSVDIHHRTNVRRDCDAEKSAALHGSRRLETAPYFKRRDADPPKVLLPVKKRQESVRSPRTALRVIAANHWE
jgi:hypothetical protein